jgi:predicted phosphodiesterase
MRIAVISDIHGNLNALRRVLDDIESQRAEDIVCLGDTVGYGPEPEECLSLVRERGIAMVMGNHEQALEDPALLDSFNPYAREALRHTATFLSPDSMDYIRRLPRFIVRHGARFVHGLPPDNTKTYLSLAATRKLRNIFEAGLERICFVGHTHELQLVWYDGERVTKDELRPGLNPVVPSYRYIVNVGSVGQPRDGDNRAKYVLWDRKAHTVELRRVDYDYKDTAAKIIARGFDKRYADRLY